MSDQQFSAQRNPTYDLTTAKGVMQAGLDHAASISYQYGNVGFGRVMGSPAFFTALRAIDAPVLAGDVEGTKAACRALWGVVRRLAQGETGETGANHGAGGGGAGG